MLPANWYWPVIGLVAHLAGVVWGWSGIAYTPEEPEDQVQVGASNQADSPAEGPLDEEEDE